MGPGGVNASATEGFYARGNGEAHGMRRFDSHEIRQAIQYAQDGGQALHVLRPHAATVQ